MDSANVKPSFRQTISHRTVHITHQILYKGKRINMSIKLKKRRLAYYITPHGFGHAIRSLEVANQLLLRAAEMEIIIVSTIPEFLLKQNLQRSLSVSQTNSKFQYSMTKTSLKFRILVIVVCLVVVICNLGFLFLQHFVSTVFLLSAASCPLQARL